MFIPIASLFNSVYFKKYKKCGFSFVFFGENLDEKLDKIKKNKEKSFLK